MKTTSGASAPALKSPSPFSTACRSLSVGPPNGQKSSRGPRSDRRHALAQARACQYREHFALTRLQRKKCPNHPMSPTRGPHSGFRVFTSPTRLIAGDPGRTFSPTSTLIFGATDAVLVDALMLTEDVDALGDMIASTGKRLTTIFITHGHRDHFFGAIVSLHDFQALP